MFSWITVWIRFSISMVPSDGAIWSDAVIQYMVDFMIHGLMIQDMVKCHDTIYVWWCDTWSNDPRYGLMRRKSASDRCHTPDHVFNLMRFPSSQQPDDDDNEWNLLQSNLEEIRKLSVGSVWIVAITSPGYQSDEVFHLCDDDHFPMNRKRLLVNVILDLFFPLEDIFPLPLVYVSVLEKSVNPASSLMLWCNFF